MAEVHAEHQQIDSWQEYIEVWAAGYSDIDKGVSVVDILQNALGITPDRQNRSTSTRLGSLLSSMNWKKYRRYVDGNRIWLWFPPKMG